MRLSTFFSTINSQTRNSETPQTRFCPLISGQFPRILGRCPFILGQWRVCRVFSQHFGTLLKTRKDFFYIMGQCLNNSGQCLNILGRTVNHIFQNINRSFLFSRHFPLDFNFQFSANTRHPQKTPDITHHTPTSARQRRKQRAEQSRGRKEAVSSKRTADSRNSLLLQPSLLVLERQIKRKRIN